MAQTFRHYSWRSLVLLLFTVVLCIEVTNGKLLFMCILKTFKRLAINNPGKWTICHLA